MRSEKVSRLYLGVSNDDQLENWSDERIWSELDARLSTPEMPHVSRGPIFERGITTMRSSLYSPMRVGRLLLAGDAAHIVPPTGAKGLNLALADVRELAPALARSLRHGDTSLLDAYSDTCLERVWRAMEYSMYMTQMLHPHPEDSFANGVQRARLTQAVKDPGVKRALARNYVNLNSAHLD